MEFEPHELRSLSVPLGFRANNLQPKAKRLSIVLSTVDNTKQGVDRAECIKAIGDDYATVAVGHSVPHGCDFSARYSSCRLSFPHYNIGILKDEKLKDF